MDKEKLQRCNELVEAIKEVEDFLEAFPTTGEDIYRCQVTVQYNATFSATVIRKTIIADRIPDAFTALQNVAMSELEKYEQEFEEL